ncbi:Uncharacterized protein SCF082_LOCUS29475 [Durusdinium trenchii]
MDQASKHVGLCEVSLLPFLRGPDTDYKLHLDGHFPVVKSSSDHITVGQLRLRLDTEWAEHAELRPKQDALSSFEAHEWKAKLEESKASVPPPTDEAAVLQAAVPLTDEARGRHLQVHLCGVRFKASAMKERSITITYRLDLNQEVSVNAELEDGDEACALLGSVKTSSTPIWPDGSGGEPALKSLHFHFWQSSRLVGLSTAKLPSTLSLEADRARRSLLLTADLDVTSLTSGDVLGLLKLALYVVPPGALTSPAQLTSLPAPLATPDSAAPQDATQVSQIHLSELEGSTAARPAWPGWPASSPKPTDTSADLVLVASAVSFEDVMARCPGFNSLEEIPKAFDFDHFCEGLLGAVDGLTAQQAARLAAEAKCGQSTVSLDLWKGVLRETFSRIEAAMNLLQEVIGGDGLGWLVEQLASFGHTSLQNTQLVALVAQKRRAAIPWQLMEECLKLLDPSGQGIAARPVAKLLSKRAEAYWLARHEQVHRARAADPVHQASGSPGEASFVAPESPAARQLISALLCLIRSGELDINEVAQQLDAAAIRVSERKPALWCSPLPEPVAVANILEGDAEGTLKALEVWQSLHLPTSVSAAVMALRSLTKASSSASPSSSGTLPRLRASESIRRMAQNQVPTAGPRSEDLFRALLSIAMGPEQLRSRLRSACGTVGSNRVHLDQFADTLQKAGVIMASADLLEVGRLWAPEGLLEIDALHADHYIWLAQRTPQLDRLGLLQAVPVDLTSMNQLSRLDLPPYVLFACLDVQHQGCLSEEALRKLEEWPSPVAHLVSGANMLYDPAGHGVVTYANFRRLCNYLDRLRPRGRADVLEMRTLVREAVVQLSGYTDGTNSFSREKGVDGLADMFGLMRLLQHVGLRQDLAELLAGAFLAVREPHSSSSSYRAFFVTMFHGQMLLQRHVEDLLKACFAASLELETILEDLMPRGSTSGALGWDTLLAALVAGGVDVSKIDTEEIVCALDPSGQGLVPVADLLATAKAFNGRHVAVLQNLAHRAHSSDGHGHGFMHLISLHKAKGNHGNFT